MIDSIRDVERLRFGDPESCPRCGIAERFQRRTEHRAMKRPVGADRRWWCGICRTTTTVFADTFLRNTTYDFRLLQRVVDLALEFPPTETQTSSVWHHVLADCSRRTVLHLRHKFAAEWRRQQRQRPFDSAEEFWTGVWSDLT